MSRIAAALGLLTLCCTAQGAGAPLLLLQNPTLSAAQIAFEYGGELWEVPRAGGQAHVLASGMDLLDGPIFSPDGSMIAFTGTYDSNTDVYVVAASGGEPRRLTYHPGPDIAVGWTPDGKDVLFRSKRHGFSDPDQLFTVPASGGFPKELPLPEAETGAYSPDGSRIAYVPGFQWEPFWKGYQGGQHAEVWIARLADSSVVKIPGGNANVNDAMWVGSTVYFLSDRDGPITLLAYDTDSKKVRRLIDNRGFDITSASSGPGGIVYSQFGQLHLYDLASGTTKLVPVTVSGELPQLRSRFEDVSKGIVSFDISPNGVRAVFEGHGDILTVPTKHGSIVNLTHSPAVMDRSPTWSPDGKFIAYFSDRDGEYDLLVSSQDGVGPVRKVALGQIDAFYQPPHWSPDSAKVVFADQKLNLWYVDLEAGTPRALHVDTNADDDFEPDWSPDSRWLVYTKSLPNNLHAVFVYALADGRPHQVTDGASDSLHAVFDPTGKYLYFTSNTDALSVQGSLDALEHPVSAHVYALALQPETASPVAPETGFEKESAKEGASDEGAASSDEAGGTARADRPGRADLAASAARKQAAPRVVIDFAGIEARAVSLPLPPANYVGLAAGPAGKSSTLYLVQAPLVLMPQDRGPNGVPVSVLRFDMSTRKIEVALRNAAWIEHNAEVVDRLSGGRLAYVYVPDTELEGYVNFDRYFFSQTNKQGVIIDERFNHGGFLPDYFIHALQAEPVSLLVERWGTRPVQTYPSEALYGPKVMIVNQYAGSGGDALPWFFKMAKVGPVIGERTWGGLVGIGAYPQLMDGGTVTAPRTAVEGLDGTFPVENAGIAPDVTVWQDPSLVREGHDPQLERAVTVALEQLRERPPMHYERPPWRNYHPHLPPLPAGE